MEKKKRKISKLRAIDTGNRYDVTGMLRRFVREAERGEHGDIRDICLIARRDDGPNARDSVYVAHYGQGTDAQVHWMVSTAKNRMEPS